jgi:hypothetical protein
LGIVNLLKINYISYTPIPNKAMTPQMLFPRIFGLLSGHDSALISVLKQIQAPGSRCLYIISKHSIQDEIIALQKVLSTESCDQINRLIRKHLDTISKDIHYLQSLESIDLYCYKIPVPPPPPPPPFIPTSLSMVKFICFFTRSTLSKVVLYKNGKELQELKGITFIDLTNTCVVRMPKDLQVNTGDTLTLKIPIRYLDGASKPQEIIIDYSERITLRE